MPGIEIVDVDLDPRTERRRRWRLGLRAGLPVAAILAMLAAIAGIAWSTALSNRRDALILSAEALRAIDERIAAEVRSYLTPAERVVQLVRWLMRDRDFLGADRDLAERLATQVLRTVPQLALVSFADAEGGFLMLRRTAEGGIDAKSIEPLPGGGRRVTWVRRDADGRITATQEDPADTYDPRTRPWFQHARAAAEGAVAWTDVYVFFTDRAPGITASARISQPALASEVAVGVDIRLDALSTFLAGLRIGQTGRAMIVDAAGRLVAFPDPQRMMKEEGGVLAAARIDELDDPVLTRAWDRLRVLGPGQHLLQWGDARYVVAQSPLQAVVGRDWSLAFVVPEADFVGFVAANNRRALWLSLVVVGLALGLAVLLCWQGLSADRNARRLGALREAAKRRHRALAALAEVPAVFDPQQADGAIAVTAALADALVVRRVSLWQLQATEGSLRCEAGWDRAGRRLLAGMIFTENDCPVLLAALFAGETIDVADTAADGRTADLHRLYLEPASCRSLLAVPVRRGEQAMASMWIEDERPRADPLGDDRLFVRTLAAMLAPRYAGAPASVAVRASGSESSEPATVPVTISRPQPDDARILSFAGREAMRTASIAGDPSRRLAERVATAAADRSLAASLFPETSVLVLRIPDPLMLAACPGRHAGDGLPPDEAEAAPLIDRLVRALQHIASERQIDYLKILSDQIVAAEGFGGDPQQSALTIVETALAIRESCAEASIRLGDDIDFRIGIDTGMVIGSAVGFGNAAYNLWGDAVRLAGAMAASAPRHAIQITESTYRHLEDRYLVRERGAYYVDRVGELATFLLRGRR